MIIPINAEIRIKGTETCWELQRVRSKKGQQVWEPFKYFSTFRQALEEAVQREIRRHPATTLSDAIRAVSNIVQKYEDLIPSSVRPKK